LDVIGVFDQAARVHDDARDFGASREPVLPIAGEPRQIGNQCIAGARHGIEQGRLAYIRPTYQCDYRQHVVYGVGGGVAAGATGTSAAGAGAATGAAGSAMAAAGVAMAAPGVAR